VRAVFRAGVLAVALVLQLHCHVSFSVAFWAKLRHFSHPSPLKGNRPKYKQTVLKQFINIAKDFLRLFGEIGTRKNLLISFTGQISKQFGIFGVIIFYGVL
jgi:hypothetical protein